MIQLVRKKLWLGSFLKFDHLKQKNPFISMEWLQLMDLGAVKSICAHFCVKCNGKASLTVLSIEGKADLVVSKMQEATVAY